MAKKAGKGKKGKKGGKKKEPEVTDELTEVEREMFQIQIADLTRRVERLKARCLELEMSNEEYQKNYATLDEDRADIIAYLKRVTQQKTEEIEELEERIDGLIKSRESEVIMYTEKISRMEHDFKIMHEQLTSEIKLLSGKLNSLEEFRVQRDELMKKFKLQENQILEQEERHKRTLYEVERKFIVGKDKLKKEMESKLIQLSNDFQDATEIRIAATTHHTIRENIAINNELDLILETARTLTAENEHMKKEYTKMRLEVQLYEKEKNTALEKSLVQVKLIKQLSEQHTHMQMRIHQIEYIVNEVDGLRFQVYDLHKKLSSIELEKRVLEQKLDAAMYEQNELHMNMAEERLKVDKLNAVIKAAVSAIKEALEVQTSPSRDEAFNLSRREGLLSQLLWLMDTATIQHFQLPPDSTEALAVYETGDLGLIPKSETDLSQRRTKSDTSQKSEDQVTSVSELDKSQSDSVDEEQKEDKVETLREVDEHQHEEHESQEHQPEEQQPVDHQPEEP